jgi:carboxymethylenebutenolidase
MISVPTKVEADGWEFWLHQSSSRVGLVLIHEIFGHDEYIESVASKLAEEGFSVVAVDLYRGRYASNLDEAFKIRASLKEEEVVDALRSGSRVLKERLGGEAKIGSMGFCMGGGFALLGACRLPLAFCVDYYGMVQNAEDVEGIKGPIQLILASEDERITPRAYRELLPALTKYKKRVDLYLYPNAKHAFHRPNWEGYNADAAKDAWSKTIGFLSAL